MDMQKTFDLHEFIELMCRHAHRQHIRDAIWIIYFKHILDGYSRNVRSDIILGRDKPCSAHESDIILHALDSARLNYFPKIPREDLYAALKPLLDGVIFRKEYIQDPSILYNFYFDFVDTVGREFGINYDVLAN